MARLRIPQSPAEWNEVGREYLPGTLGVEILSLEPDALRARMRVEKRLCASNGYLHAGAVVSFADTCCGYATVNNLPEDADSFTTLELKSNFFELDIGLLRDPTGYDSGSGGRRNRVRRDGDLRT